MRRQKPLVQRNVAALVNGADGRRERLLAVMALVEAWGPVAFSYALLARSRCPQTPQCRQTGPSGQRSFSK